MRTVINILKSMMAYILWNLALAFVCTRILVIMGYKMEMPYFPFVLYFAADVLSIVKSDVHSTAILLYLYKVLNLGGTAVFTGYVFACILHRIPRLLMPPKLVIRHRSSEGSQDILALGVLIGNRSHSLHDVKCILTCSYIKSLNPIEFNAEFQVEKKAYNLHNYYRFSFELDQFPKQLLSDLLNKKSHGYKHDYISVSIIGHSNNIGNSFNVYKRYKLCDIVFDEYVPHPTIKRRTLYGKNYDVIKWSELRTYTKSKKVAKAQRKRIITEIKYIIGNQ